MNLLLSFLSSINLIAIPDAKIIINTGAATGTKINPTIVATTIANNFIQYEQVDFPAEREINCAEINDKKSKPSPIRVGIASVEKPTRFLKKK